MYSWFNDIVWPETYQQLFLIYYYYAGCYVWTMSEMVKYKGSVLLKRPKSGPVYHWHSPWNRIIYTMCFNIKQKKKKRISSFPTTNGSVISEKKLPLQRNKCACQPLFKEAWHDWQILSRQNYTLDWVLQSSLAPKFQV